MSSIKLLKNSVKARRGVALGTHRHSSLSWAEKWLAGETKKAAASFAERKAAAAR